MTARAHHRFGSGDSAASAVVWGTGEGTVSPEKDCLVKAMTSCVGGVGADARSCTPSHDTEDRENDGHHHEVPQGGEFYRAPNGGTRPGATMAATLVVQSQSMFPTSSRPSTRYTSTPNAPSGAAGHPPHMTSHRIGQPAGCTSEFLQRLSTGSSGFDKQRSGRGYREDAKPFLDPLLQVENPPTRSLLAPSAQRVRQSGRLKQAHWRSSVRSTRWG